VDEIYIQRFCFLGRGELNMNKRNINSIRPAVAGEAKGGIESPDDLYSGRISRPARVEIDTRALRHNISIVKTKLGNIAELMAVVKADAYGHGAVKVSEIASEEGVDYLGVALLEEAEEIRNAGIETPVVLLYPEDFSRSLEALKSGFIITVSDIETPRRLAGALKGLHVPVRYFLCVNTGMNRYGIRFRNEESFFNSIATGEEYVFMGFTTNLAGSNGGIKQLSLKQEETFLELTSSALGHFGPRVYFSYESSGSISRKNIATGTLIRVGHLLYGPLDPGTNDDGLMPVMSVKSQVAEIQHLKKGEGIGYGFSYIAEKDMRIAVIPMGYADGYPWSLSNRGSVLIRGEFAPVAGRICMDAFMVDISHIGNCRQGDEAVVMGAMGDRIITAHILGEWAGSFSYEMVSRWSRRLPRIYR
jgi:alanine racemase